MHSGIEFCLSSMPARSVPSIVSYFPLAFCASRYGCQFGCYHNATQWHSQSSDDGDEISRESAPWSTGPPHKNEKLSLLAQFIFEGPLSDFEGPF